MNVGTLHGSTGRRTPLLATGTLSTLAIRGPDRRRAGLVRYGLDEVSRGSTRTMASGTELRRRYGIDGVGQVGGISSVSMSPVLAVGLVAMWGSRPWTVSRYRDLEWCTAA